MIYLIVMLIGVVGVLICFALAIMSLFNGRNL